MARLIEEEAHRRRKPIKQIVNEALRRGLSPRALARPKRRFSVQQRTSTNRRVFTEPLGVDDAIGRAQRWLQQENVTYLIPSSEHLEIAFRDFGRFAGLHWVNPRSA